MREKISMRTWETGINQTTTAVPQIQCPISKTNTNNGGGANVKLSIIKVALSAQRSTTMKKDAGLKRKKICKKAMGHVFFLLRSITNLVVVVSY